MSEAVHPMAYCPACRKRYPFRVPVIGGNFSLMGSATNFRCPLGHLMQIEDQHYDSTTRKLGIFPLGGGYVEIQPLIELIIDDIQSGRKTPEEGFEQALAFLPPSIAASIQQDSLLSPVGRLRLALAQLKKHTAAFAVAGGVLSAAGNATQIAGWFHPGSPPAQTIINNNTTNIYPPASRHEESGTGAEAVGGHPKRLSEVQGPEKQLKGKAKGKPGHKPRTKPQGRHKP